MKIPSSNYTAWRRSRLAVLFVMLAFAAGNLLATPEAITRGPGDRKQIALVFTGHEYAEGGENILEALSTHNARASFFLTGTFLANTNFQPLVRRLIAAGHYLGPHSDQHLLYCTWERPYRTLVTRDQFRADLRANLQKIQELGAGTNRVGLFLPSYEHYNNDILAWTAELNLRLVTFTAGTRSNADYTGEADRNFVSSQAIYDSILAHEQRDPSRLNGFILLLHVGSGPGRKDKFHTFIPALLNHLRSNGYSLVRIDTLLD